MTDIPGPRLAAARIYRSDFCAPRHRPLVLVAAVLGSAMGFIDGTVVSFAIPAIRAELGSTLAQAQWVSNAYMLPLAALILLGGAFGDRFGPARVFGTGIAVFLMGSFSSALSGTTEWLIASRAVQGLGAAAMIPGSLAVLSRAYPREVRGRAIGLWAASSAVTAALGPAIGGVVLTAGGDEAWRWIFAINLPLALAALALMACAVGRDAGAPGTPVDWVGGALAALTLACFALPLTVRGTEEVYFLIAAGFGALFLLWERMTPHPMLPLAVFLNTRFSAANVVSFCLYFAMSAVLFYLPMTVIAGWGVSAIAATVAFAPISIFVGLFSGPMGRRTGRYGPGKLTVAGALLVSVGFAALALVAPTHAYWLGVLPAMSVIGLGLALVIAPISVTVMESLPDDRSGAASGINNAVTRVAGLIAVAAMGAVAQTGYLRAEGPRDFGAPGRTDAHVAAMDAGFVLLAWTVAGVALIGALVAQGWLRRRR